MGTEKQVPVLDQFATRRPGNPLFCHQEFLEKLEANRNNAIGRRAALLLQRLLVDDRRLPYKGTLGVNRGWRRSRLGGNGGCHFYAWWAPRSAPPLQGLAEFDAAAEQAIFIRDIRHHDDHSPLNPQSLDQNYLPVGIQELRLHDYVPAPWTPPQAKFAQARQFVRFIKGYPGSGKTTALWHAAEMAACQSLLYVTYSPDLAALARDHFDKFSPAQKSFHVVTFAQLLRDILGRDIPFEPAPRSRERFVKEISGLSPRFLGPWVNSRRALYDEMHAHLVGAALPVAVGRFPASPPHRLADRVYRDAREGPIGRSAAAAVLEVAATLRQRDTGSFEEHAFPELALAWDAVEALRGGRTETLESRGLLGFDAVALDEAQDLTPLEALVVMELTAALQNRHRRPIPLLAAGDEAQTVRPTDFEWGWFHDLAHHRIGTPAEFRLGANLRSPRRIAEIINRVWDLYGNLAKQERPSGSGLAEIDEDASDQIVLCSATPGPELDQLLAALVDREGLAVISLDDEIPAYVPEPLRDRILTVFESKGLDFQAVCVLDAGKYLDRIVAQSNRYSGETDIESLSKRLAIDQLRVALSRPTDRLYWLDVSAGERARDLSRRFLSVTAADPEVFPAIPAVVLKMLEEELLLAEERIRLCEADARQLIGVKPAMALSRAQQAVALADADRAAAVDRAIRCSAHHTLAEVAFRLAFQKAALGAELGRPDLYGLAALHATVALRTGLAQILRQIGALERAEPAERGPQLIAAALAITQHRGEFEPWLAAELAPRVNGWIEALEKRAADPTEARSLSGVLAELYEALQLPDAAARAVRTRQKALQVLVDNRLFESALEVTRALPDADPALVAACYEGAGDFAAAAERYLAAGKPKEALRNYRHIPDLAKSLELVATLEDHPAAASLRWLERMRALAAERPAEFNRVMQPAEKKLLEELLETSLGIARKKPAARKAATKKTAAPAQRVPRRAKQAKSPS